MYTLSERRRAYFFRLNYLCMHVCVYAVLCSVYRAEILRHRLSLLLSSSSFIKKILSVYDFLVLNNDKNKIFAFTIMFSSLAYTSSSSGSLIIEKKVMNVTLSLCTREQATENER